MAAKAVKSWIDTYEPGIQKHYDKLGQGLPDKIEDFWKKWVDDNTQGLECLAPFATKATALPDNFKLSLPPTGTAPVIALLMANAWKGYMEKIQYAPPPPSPPFSVITLAAPSKLGLVTAYAALLSGLIAEMSLIPPDPLSAFKLKATSFGTLFHTATISVGVELTGLSLSVPPAPLFLPLVPTL